MTWPSASIGQIKAELRLGEGCGKVRRCMLLNERVRPALIPTRERFKTASLSSAVAGRLQYGLRVGESQKFAHNFDDARNAVQEAFRNLFRFGLLLLECFSRAGHPSHH